MDTVPDNDRPDADSERETDIAALIRLAGHRPEPDAARTARAKAAAHREWQQAASRRRTRTLWRSGALAATLLVGLAILGYVLKPTLMPRATPTSSPATAPAGARLIRVMGHVASSASTPAAADALASWVALRVGDVWMNGADLRTGANGRAALRLSNGAGLRMDERTHLRLEGNGRVRLMSGAVYVDSGDDPDARVEILTPLGTVRDIGTQFEVSLTASRLRTRVREGEVVLRHQDSLVQAKAGEAVSLTSNGALERRPATTHGEEWNWVGVIAPAFPVEGASVSGLLAWVGREQGWRWRFADAATEQRARDVVLHGTVDGLTPMQTLNAVLPTCGMTYRVHNGELIASFVE